MDFSSFGDENWDLLTWVNSAFKDVTKEKRDTYAASLLTKLQLVSQDISKTIEEAAEQGAQAVPKAAREMEAVRQEANFLKRHMNQVKEGLEDVEQKTNSSIQVLFSIDQIKERVESSEASLKKVDNWAQITQEAENAFTEQDLKTIAEKIAQLDQSILIFQGAPDYGEKQKLLDSFKNRLEATLSSKAIQSTKLHDIQAAKETIAHFASIGRVSQFESYYIKTSRAKFKESWELTEQFDRTTTLYENLVQKASSELVFITAVFGEEGAENILIKSFTDILKYLPIKEAIKDLLDENDPSLSMEKISAHRLAAEQFVGKMQTFLEAKSCNASDVQNFVQILWVPYGAAIIAFKDLMSSTLAARVSDLRIDGDSMALLENIANATGHLVEMHNYAMDTCKESTGSLGLLMLAEAIAFSHKKLTERAFSAIEDAKIRSRKSDANDDNIWPFFSNSLQMLERFGPWIKELDRLEEVFHEELKAIERFSSASMMNKDNEDPWNFNILRLCAPKNFGELQGFIDQSISKSSTLLTDSHASFARLAQLTTDVAFDTAFVPIRCSFKSLADMDLWNKAETPLPEFGYSPSEEITQVGDALLTIPQHLDPLQADNSDLKRAVLCTKLPYTENLPDVPESEENTDEDIFEHHHGAGAWLANAGHGACKLFMEQIFKIPELSEWGRLQLVCDLRYLESVGDSLGVEISEEWKALVQLLAASDEDLDQLASTAPQTIADKVYKMRKNQKE